MMSSAYTITGNAIGKVRHETVDGKAYLVAPLTLIVPGVLPGSKGPLYYPVKEIARSVDSWEGMPLTAYHPTDPLTNSPMSASEKGVWDRQGLGFVRNPHQTEDGKLHAEGWYDVEKTQEVDPRIYNSLIAGKPIELSTGLYTENLPTPGVDPRGRVYEAIARNYKPDHVATLPDEEGACSLRDGCGVLINKNLVSNARGNPDALRRWYEDGADGEIDWSADHGAKTACHERASQYMSDDDAWVFCQERAEAVGYEPSKETRNALFERVLLIIENCGGPGSKKPGPCSQKHLDTATKKHADLFAAHVEAQKAVTDAKKYADTAKKAAQITAKKHADAKARVAAIAKKVKAAGGETQRVAKEVKKNLSKEAKIKAGVDKAKEKAKAILDKAGVKAKEKAKAIVDKAKHEAGKKRNLPDPDNPFGSVKFQKKQSAEDLIKSDDFEPEKAHGHN